MSAAYGIAWFVGLLFSMKLIFVFIGNIGMCSMFPEGFRWWSYPAALGSLAVFAAVALNHPF